MEPPSSPSNATQFSPYAFIMIVGSPGDTRIATLPDPSLVVSSIEQPPPLPWAMTWAMVFPADPEIAVTVDSTVWKEILVGRRNPVVAFASGAVEIEGSTLDLVNFLRLFERS